MQGENIRNLFNKKKNINDEKLLNNSNQEVKLSDDDYYQVASSWRVQIYEAQTVWLQRSMLANLILGVLLAISSLVILKQTNAHIVEPIVIEKDKATGSYSVIDRVTPSTYANDWPLIRFNLTQYVESREQYHIDNLNIPYQDAYYKSTDDVANELTTELSSDNKNAPINLYKDTKYITIKVNNIQRLSDTDSALVEFTKTLHEKSGNQIKDFQYRAIIKWVHSNEKMELNQYYKNPFNFKVSYYKATPVTNNI